MVVTVAEAKLYLRIDGDEEDTLIASLMTAAEELCEDILRTPLAAFTDTPEAVKQAVLYACGNLYENREAADLKDVIEVMRRILFAYRKEAW